MPRLLREPFLHFALLGVLVFVFDGWLRSRTVEAGAGEIVVSAGRIDNLAAMYTRTWQRPPTPEELRRVIDEYVLEEALYREGVTLGVDQGDSVIRRRVRQKMDFFVDDLVDNGQPAQGELEAWLEEHAEDYEVPAEYTFRQVYLNADARGETVVADAEAILAQLRAADNDIDPARLGDSTLLQSAFSDVRTDQLANSFGREFAEQFASLPVGEWSGPVESPYGLHLVYIDSSTPSRSPSLAEVRGPVERDWSHARREAATTEFYRSVVGRYDVKVEWDEFVAGLADEDALAQ